MLRPPICLQPTKNNKTRVLWGIFFCFCKHSLVILPAESGKKPHKKMSGCWRAAIWGKRSFIFKEHDNPFLIHFSNIKNKGSIFFSQKLRYRDNLYNKVSPLDWKGKLSEHKKCMFCTKRGLKVSTKMNAITTEVFSPQHNLAATQFKVKITFHGIMQYLGGLLAKAVQKNWNQRCHIRGEFAKSGSELLTCQNCINLQFWAHMERGSTFHSAN